MKKNLNVLFIGDIFGRPAVEALATCLAKLVKLHRVDFVIAQSENVSDRKGLVKADYERLKEIGVQAFTLGNHVWAKDGIKQIIANSDVIRPFNVHSDYPGEGTRVFKIASQTLRVTSMLGVTFNELTDNWKQSQADNFFDAFDLIEKDYPRTDYHLIDFHGETTSEKNVFGLYVDGKASALVGTHTHVQTNDARILPRGLAYITDAGMTGPSNSAIGAEFKSVYRKMRFDARSKFIVSQNRVQFNGVLIRFSPHGHKIKSLNFLV
ncbi:TIGR00282 family metallophosphoesterase [Mycoplasma sp. ATU-Cv-703]|uniref:YmdB family metallophosphoesterase n=1 Tax=Mycoplasma sp. ATU-Cv-703 TaxID=2498595 RepID=UPI000FDEBB61